MLMTLSSIIHLFLGLWLGLWFRKQTEDTRSPKNPPTAPETRLYVNSALALERQIAALLHSARQPSQLPVGALAEALGKLLEITREMQCQFSQREAGDPVSVSCKNFFSADRITISGDLPCEPEPSRHRIDDSNGHKKRHSYIATQWAASVPGAELPNPRDFKQVQCLELSTHELCYVSNEWTTDDHVIVSVGPCPNLTFLLAEVVQLDMKLIDDEWKECIRCRFVKRLSGAYVWNSEQKCLAAGPEIASGRLLRDDKASTTLLLGPRGRDTISLPSAEVPSQFYI